MGVGRRFTLAFVIGRVCVARPTPTPNGTSCLRIGTRRICRCTSLHHRRDLQPQASSDSRCLFVNGGRAPLSHFPPDHAGSEQSSLPLFFQSPGPRKPRTSDPEEARGRLGTPTSGRHHGAQAQERRLPVGTRGSAKPAPMTPGPANVSAPFHSGGANGPTRSRRFLPVGTGVAARSAATTVTPLGLSQ